MPSDLVNYRRVYPWNTANTDIGYYFLLKIGSKKYNLAHSMAHWAYLPWPKSICLSCLDPKERKHFWKIGLLGTTLIYPLLNALW